MDRINFPFDNIPLKSLRIYISVVDAASFSEAAKQFRIGVPAVSKHISLLEESMGVALLLRTTRKVTVTEAGREFYGRCLSILRMVSEATSSQHSGHIRISAAPSVSSSILNPHMGRFLTEHPDITIDFFVTSALPDLIRDRIDVAIVLREWPGVKLSHRNLGTMKRVLCASPGYIETHGAPTDQMEIRSHRVLMSLLKGEVDPWVCIDEGKRRTLSVRPVMLSDNGDTIRQACIQGAGIANLYRFHGQDDIDAGNLVEILPEIEIEPVGLYAVMPHKDMINRATLSFLDFFQQIIEEGPWKHH
ncbi:LysR substrate-binding domain-containing protein [Brucella sp. BE17]|uniref:LysR family transcriptional regulator n=1 Tax=Brucella sp. BE17 TaxID=3142977 RepID=UPI0031BA12F2